MARPHPVVGIRSELSNGRRRGTDHTDITVHGFYEHIIFVPAVKGFELQFGSGSNFYVFSFGKTFRYFTKIAGGQVIDSVRIRIFFQLLVDVIRHIKNPIDISNGQSRSRELRIAVHCPKAFCQIVVLHVAVLLDGSVTTVVVSQYQSFGRDNLSRASSSEVYDCIFQRKTVGIVNLFNRNLKSKLAHGNFILCFQVGQHPHTFVGVDTERCQ